MMKRYRKGRCAAFDYRAYWMNAIATGSAMRALMPKFGIADVMADDAFAVGLASSIGWLAVAGKATDHRNWGECLAHATRAAQRLAPFDCLAVLPLAEVPPPCLKEWENWQHFFAGQ